MSRAYLFQETMGNYIGGKFQKPSDPNGKWELRSPADVKDHITTIFYSYADVDRALEAARSAFKKWKRIPVAERAQYLNRYKDALKSHQDALMSAISREMGKPLWESKTEVSAMMNKVDVTLGDSLKLVEGYQLPKVMDQTDGTCLYHPLGVVAVVGPFNFPGHLPNGHILPALITGNTVVFKPSEKTPLVGQIMAECFHEAGFPEGVFNLVQGEREVGRRLSVHEGVNAVLFTGSYEVGNRIKQETLQQHWKLLALEMGGKNAAIVCEDTDLAVAVREAVIGSFITSGQRCSCTSRILVHEKLLQPFVEEFHKRAKNISIGHPFDNPFMGPVIDSASKDRYLKFMGMASREGHEVLMRGKALELADGTEGDYVTPSICIVKKNSPTEIQRSVYVQTELFAPNVCIIPFKEDEEAIVLANGTQYGLVCSVFTPERTRFDKYLEDIEAGLINWNRSTVGASGRLPFGGIKKSGNFFPAGVSSPLYCTYPVATLEIAHPTSDAPSKTTYPGLNWA